MQVYVEHDSDKIDSSKQMQERKFAFSNETCWCEYNRA